ELYLAGHQLTPGYINRDDENRKAFFNNPFDDAEGYEYIYGTGDMVRFLPDGSLGIVGRQDSQVKIRGNRVELTEVESVIRNIDGVDDVTVQTVDNNGNNELVAYVVISNDLEDDDLVDYVRTYVGEHKPDYMVPSFVIDVDVVPLTVNGKVDRRALPDVDVDSLRVEYVAPSDETEKAIVNAFEVVFNQRGIGLYDDFIRLGGDSISAIRLISLLEKDDISCSARDILNYKTPYLIAQNVGQVFKKSYDATVGEVDLLPIQSFFFDQIGSNDFSQDFILKSKFDLDLYTLQCAFDELCDVHDMLRASYNYDEEGVVQEVLPLGSRVCDVKEYTTDDLDNVVKNIIDESKKSLDICGDLIKISLVHCDDEAYVVFVIHHLIIDGVSWSILIDDLSYIINQIRNNNEIDILRPYPYKDWVRDVKSLVDGISDDEVEHWVSLNGLLVDSIICGDSKGFSFGVDVSFDLDNLFMLSEEEYLALCIARAYKKTYGEDIIFNRESYGRDDGLADVSRTLGWFTSQFPVLVDTDNGYDIVSLMCDVYNIKDSFKDVNYLGLNYGSLIYTDGDLDYKHCPVTFNFLSGEFSFENDLFESVNYGLSKDDVVVGGLDLVDLDGVSFGISLNVSRVGEHYVVGGDYADGTYLGDKFSDFVENIKYELSFIANYKFDNIVCCLSEPQLGVYLDEKVHDKDTAYSTPGIFECDENYSVDEIKGAIHALVEKHPILKGRVVETEDLPLLVCDSYPEISVSDVDDYSKLIRPFDLGKCLVRFFIVDSNDSRYVVYDMHHMINDATSRTIINGDLSLALRGELDDEVDLGFVYASRDSFESQFKLDYESAHRFFSEMFVDIDDVFSLLDDVDGCVGCVSLPIRGVRENVLSFVRDKGITVSSFLNAVFAYTYSRFVGGSKVCYTFTEHGRHEDYSQDALGMFVRTVPVLVDCSNRSVGDYLSGVSDLILEAMGSSVYPFRLLASEFDLSNSVSFGYNYDLNDVSAIGDSIVFSDEADRVSDLLCVVNDLDDGFLVSLNHLDKLSQDTAERFVKVFKEILVQFLDKEVLEDINYISNEDMGLLDGFNDTEYDLDYVDVLDAFNDNLKDYEDNVLVGYEDRYYTYGEGAFIANEIAHCLGGLGVARQDFVALFVERSEWFLLASLGVLSIGGVYVPIDTDYPDERIVLMLKDTDSKFVLVSDKSENRMREIIRVNNLDIDVLNVDGFKENISSLGHLDNVCVDVDDVACVLYTSGTTGTPKGVLVSRKAVNNFVLWYVDETNFTSDDVYGMHCSYVFDMHVHALYAPLVSGGSLYVVPDDIRLDLKALNDYFVEHGCTHTYITSQVGKLFAESGMDSSIRLLCFGGMKLGELNAPDSMGPFETYGPSENLAVSTSIFANERIDNSSIGHFISNVKGYVLDSERRRVPVGAVGELYLSGVQLTKGYLNREDENSKVFFDNSFDDDVGYERIYKTGDMVRFLPDGSLGIVGRRDSQVKIRGNRVELGEVESVIRNIGFVEDVTVQTVNKNDNDELVAYVVVSSDGFESNLTEFVCNYVASRKPDYMVPSFVVELDEVPLTVNGKVDKSALPDVDFGSLVVEYVAPCSEIEGAIVDAFEKVFNHGKVGVYDDFVGLGGDSLSAIKLLSYL
ncbi:amino acid adenylation domain-containing protein, partial [Methanobrevibacter sp.]